MKESEQNLRIAEQICTEFTWNGRKFRQGDFIALLDGQIVAVADNPNDAIRALRKRASDPQRGMVVEVTRPGVEIIR